MWGGVIGFTCATFWPFIKLAIFPYSNIPEDQRHLYKKENYFRDRREKEMQDQYRAWQRRGLNMTPASGETPASTQPIDCGDSKTSGLTWNEKTS